MLQVHYNDKPGTMRGSANGKEDIVRLAPGEWITEIEGTFSGGAIAKLSFLTSKGMRSVRCWNVGGLY